uniref:Uncharacterized protein n=1 Tax=Leptocylindrus danicus TaxID=163516 RepID=A0A7S2LJZ0_9STRA|mmetsp:Transcript_6680/g.9893  ORF Transcript_6680/g.9893 Transcript_6680/m.9893 type:complete len:135 (+) Transcript_6680:133-537(+)
MDKKCRLPKRSFFELALCSVSSAQEISTFGGSPAAGVIAAYSGSGLVEKIHFFGSSSSIGQGHSTGMFSPTTKKGSCGTSGGTRPLRATVDDTYLNSLFAAEQSMAAFKSGTQSRVQARRAQNEGSAVYDGHAQ